MVHDDNLKVRGKRRRRISDQLEKLQYRRLVLVGQDVQRALSIALGRVVRLRRLVKD